MARSAGCYADGTTANMPDTTENEQAYPQLKSQKKK